MIDRIIETKRREVSALQKCEVLARKRPLVPFQLKNGVNIIAELKRRSPSAGAIGEIDDTRIAVYNDHATAISVLTDGTYFNGSFEVLEDVADKTTIPVLCKDFIIHESQIDLAWSKGADMILLIARILDEEALKALYFHARDLGLGCLVEVHEAKELAKVSAVGASIVGVNARDLDTLTVDLDRARQILRSVDAPVRVAESGIRSRRDIEGFGSANCFLIGETLMRSNDPASVFRELLHD